jgi:hypothetical protein
VLRYAFIALAFVLVLLVVLSLLPQNRAVIPDSTIDLQNAKVVLYPQQDQDAVWRFSSPTVEYNPDSRDTTLFNVQDGERVENGETDFTLESPQVTISNDDNLRGDKIVVDIANDDITVDMQSKGDTQVVIDQAQAKFIVPYVKLSGEIEGEFENFVSDFEIRKFTSGGPGTVGYSQFELAKRESDQE